MNRRRLLQAGTILWVVAGATVALSTLGGVNEDARLLVGAASVVGPLLGIGAAVLLGRKADRWAGFLLVSAAVLTPTYFAYALNLPALVIGLALVVAARRLSPDHERERRSDALLI